MVLNLATFLQYLTLFTLLSIEQFSIGVVGRTSDRLHMRKEHEGHFIECVQMRNSREYCYNSCPCGTIDSDGEARQKWKHQDSKDFRNFLPNVKNPSNELDMENRATMNRTMTRIRTSMRHRKALPLIAEGVFTEVSEAPWYVLLEDLNTAKTCGGSIINMRYILTTAHCTEAFRKRDSNSNQIVQQPYPFNIIVILKQPNVCQKSDILLPSYRRRVIRVIDHPRYRKTRNLVFDFALLMVDRRMNNFGKLIRPICLPPKSMLHEQFIGKVGTVSGYGLTEPDKIDGLDKISCHVEVANSMILRPDYPLCSRVLQNKHAQICGLLLIGSDACRGESGGPLTSSFFNRDTYANYLIGVFSYGSQKCAPARAASVYGRVTRIIPWLVSRIQEGECKYFSRD